MAQRFAAANHLVECCVELGFKDFSLGYQTILYSNVNELRRLLMWLIERMPKLEDQTDTFQPISHKGKYSENEFLGKLTNDLKSPWILEVLQPKCNYYSITTDLIHCRLDQGNYNKYNASYNLKGSILDFPQCKQPQLEPPTFDETNTLSSQLGSFMISDKPILNESENGSKLNGIELMAESLNGLKRKVEGEDGKHKQLLIEQMENRKSIGVDVRKIEELKQRNKLKKRIALLLDEPENSKDKLINSLRANKKKHLNDKFEQTQQQLEVQLKALSDTNSAKAQKSVLKMEEQQRKKLKTQNIQKDLKKKNLILNQLKTVLSQTRQTTHPRSAHTSRIFDIVKSIGKQNIDIAEIIGETKSIQKSINSAVGQNQRQFTLTEDIIWNNVSSQVVLVIMSVIPNMFWLPAY